MNRDLHRRQRAHVPKAAAVADAAAAAVAGIGIAVGADAAGAVRAGAMAAEATMVAADAGIEGKTLSVVSYQLD